MQNLRLHRDAHIAHHLAPLRNDLFDGERIEIDAQPRLHHQHRALDSRPEQLDAGEWCKEAFALVRVLRDPPELAPAVDHAHVHFKHQPRLAWLARVLQGHLAVECGAHKGALDAAPDALSIRRPEALREHASRDAAVDRRRLGELRGLDNHRVDHMNGRDVPIGLAAGECCPKATQQVIVLDEHRACIQPSSEPLLQHELWLLEHGELGVDLVQPMLELAQRQWLASRRMTGPVLFDVPLFWPLHGSVRRGDEPPLDLRRRCHHVV